MVRMHWSSWFVLVVAMAAGIVANVGGDEGQLDDYSFGWPFVFGSTAKHYVYTNFDGPPEVLHWRPDRISAWSYGLVAANALTLIGIAAALSFVWEYCCRRRPRWRQLSLADGFAVLTLAGAVIGFGRHLYRYQDCEQRLSNAVEGTGIIVQVTHDVPADWFWETLRIPSSWQPRQPVKVEFSQGLFSKAESGVELRAAAVDILDSISTLRELSLYSVLPPLGCTPDLSAVQEVDCQDDALDDARLRFFAKTRRLTALDLGGKQITDAGLRNFAGNPNLRGLVVWDGPQVQLTDLSSWPSLGWVSLNRVDLSRSGCEALARLPELESLCINQCDRVTLAGWSALARSSTLNSLSVWGSFDDEAMEAVSRSTTISSLGLDETQITDEGVRHLSQMKNLRSLLIEGESSSLLTEASLQYLTESMRSVQKECGLWGIDVLWANDEALTAARQLGIKVNVACRDMRPDF